VEKFYDIFSISNSCDAKKYLGFGNKLAALQVARARLFIPIYVGAAV
jgi:hypothetical protein